MVLHVGGLKLTCKVQNASSGGSVPDRTAAAECACQGTLLQVETEWGLWERRWERWGDAGEAGMGQRHEAAKQPGTVQGISCETCK